MTTLIMVRHGESEANRNKVFAGHLDVDLQNNGIKQAKKTAQYIVDNYKVDKIYSSDLKRAFNTGKCIADLIGIDIIPEKNLREIYAGKWDGIKFDDIYKLYNEDYSIWLNNIGNAHCTEGETVKELSQRIIHTLTKIALENDGATIVITTHATPIRVMQCYIEKGDLNEMKNIPWVSNASVSVFEYDNKIWKIKQISYDEHLGEFKTQLPKNV